MNLSCKRIMRPAISKWDYIQMSKYCYHFIAFSYFSISYPIINIFCFES